MHQRHKRQDKGRELVLWWGWSYLLTAIGCTGIFLAGRHNKYGWLLGVCAQVVWMTYGIVTAQYGFCVSAVFYGFFQGKNFLAWLKAEKSEATA